MLLVVDHKVLSDDNHSERYEDRDTLSEIRVIKWKISIRFCMIHFLMFRFVYKIIIFYFKICYTYYNILRSGRYEISSILRQTHNYQFPPLTLNTIISHHLQKICTKYHFNKSFLSNMLKPCKHQYLPSISTLCAMFSLFSGLPLLLRCVVDDKYYK